MVEVGQICKKIAGREKGRYCVVVKIDGKFAEISGIKKYGMCKRRRCNLKHLNPTKFKIQLKGEKQEEVERSLSESGIIKRLNLIKEKRRKKKAKRIVEKNIKPKKNKKKPEAEKDMEKSEKEVREKETKKVKTEIRKEVKKNSKK